MANNIFTQHADAVAALNNDPFWKWDYPGSLSGDPSRAALIVAKRILTTVWADNTGQAGANNALNHAAAVVDILDAIVAELIKFPGDTDPATLAARAPLKISIADAGHGAAWKRAPEAVGIGATNPFPAVLRTVSDLFEHLVRILTIGCDALGVDPRTTATYLLDMFVAKAMTQRCPTSTTNFAGTDATGALTRLITGYLTFAGHYPGEGSTLSTLKITRMGVGGNVRAGMISRRRSKGRSRGRAGKGKNFAGYG